jgi:hypothetical protein
MAFLKLYRIIVVNLESRFVQYDGVGYFNGFLCEFFPEYR